MYRIIQLWLLNVLLLLQYKVSRRIYFITLYCILQGRVVCLCIGLTVVIQVNVLCVLAVELLAVLVGAMGRYHFTSFFEVLTF